MVIERTTLAADAEDLALLRREAERRRVSLAALLREIVAHEADALRAARPKPRFGFVSSGVGLSTLADESPDEPYEAHPFRS